MIDDRGGPIPGASVTLASLSAENTEAQSVMGSSGSLPPPDNSVPDLSFVRAFGTGTDKETGRWVLTKTGPDGRFSLEPLHREGASALRIEAEGFLSAYRRLDSSNEKEMPPLVLVRGIPVRGLVLDVTGKAVTDASVRIQGQSWSGPPESDTDMEDAYVSLPQSTCRTNEDGRFVLSVKRHCTLTLRAESPSQGMMTFPGLPSDSPTPLTLRFSARSALQGRVLWNDGSPAQGCIVCVRQPWTQFDGYADSKGSEAGAGGAFGGGSNDSLRCTVGADGTYRLRGVEPDRDVVVSVTDPAGAPIADDTPIAALRSGQSATWNYTVPKPATIRGTVRGTASGKAVPGILVHCVAADETNAGPCSRTQAKTGADGRYELRVFPSPGTYRIVANYQRNGSPARSSSDEGTVLVSLKAAETLTGIDMTLPEPCSRSFRVVSANGKPVDGCVVQVRELMNGSYRMWRWPGRTKDGGRVKLSGLPPETDVECLFSSPEGSGTSAIHRSEPAADEQEETVPLAAKPTSDPHGVVLTSAEER